MDKKTLLPLGLLVVIALVSLGAYYNILKARQEASEFPPGPGGNRPSDLITNQQTSKSGATIRTDFIGRHYYAMTGQIVAKLRVDGEIIRGEFILDDDPSKTRLPVIFTPNSMGKFALARFNGVFAEGAERATLVDASEVVSAAAPKTQIQLRIMYHDSQTPTAEDLRAQAFLESVIADNPSTPVNILLQPAGVGVLE